MLKIVKNVSLPAKNSFRRSKYAFMQKMEINDVVFVKSKNEAVCARQCATKLGYKVTQRRISDTEIGMWRVA